MIDRSSNNISLFEDQGYTKALGRRHVQMIAIGGAIGSGLFLGTADRLRAVGPALVLLYALAAAVAFMVVRALGELGMHRPTSGSFVSYSREFLGEKAAYFAGWMYFLNWACSGIADVTAAALYARFFFPALPQWIPALIALVVVLAVNLASVRIFGELEFWFAAIKVVTLVAFMVVGIVVLISRHNLSADPTAITGPALLLHQGAFAGGVLAALTVLQGVVFSYAGVEMVGVAAGEADAPRQIIPAAVNGLLRRIGLLYVGSVLLLVLLLPTTAYQAGTSPFVTVLARLGIPGAAQVLDVVVLTAALSSVNSGLYTTGRVLRSLAYNGSAPLGLGRMSRHGVPYVGVLLTGFIYLVGVYLNLVMPGSAFEIAIGFSSVGIIGIWFMIMASHLAMYRASRDGFLTRPTFRLPGAPYTNYLTLGILLAVPGMTWFNGQPGRIVVSSLPVIAALLALGWLGVRGRAERIRHIRMLARQMELHPNLDQR